MSKSKKEQKNQNNASAKVVWRSNRFKKYPELNGRIREYLDSFDVEKVGEAKKAVNAAFPSSINLNSQSAVDAALDKLGLGHVNIVPVVETTASIPTKKGKGGKGMNNNNSEKPGYKYIPDSKFRASKELHDEAKTLVNSSQGVLLNWDEFGFMNHKLPDEASYRGALAAAKSGTGKSEEFLRKFGYIPKSEREEIGISGTVVSTKPAPKAASTPISKPVTTGPLAKGLAEVAKAIQPKEGDQISVTITSDGKSDCAAVKGHIVLENQDVITSLVSAKITVKCEIRQISNNHVLVRISDEDMISIIKIAMKEDNNALSLFGDAVVEQKRQIADFARRVVLAKKSGSSSAELIDLAKEYYETGYFAQEEYAKYFQFVQYVSDVLEEIYVEIEGLESAKSRSNEQLVQKHNDLLKKKVKLESQLQSVVDVTEDDFAEIFGESIDLLEVDTSSEKENLEEAIRIVSEEIEKAELDAKKVTSSYTDTLEKLEGIVEYINIFLAVKEEVDNLLFKVFDYVGFSIEDNEDQDQEILEFFEENEFASPKEEEDVEERVAALDAAIQ